MPKVEINDRDLEEIGKLIAEGKTSGRLHCGDDKIITWKIEMDAWIND